MALFAMATQRKFDSGNASLQLSFGERPLECAPSRQLARIARLSPLKCLHYLRVRDRFPSLLWISCLCSFKAAAEAPAIRGRVLDYVWWRQRNETSSKGEATAGPPDGSPGRAMGPQSLPETQGSIDEEETRWLFFRAVRRGVCQ